MEENHSATQHRYGGLAYSERGKCLLRADGSQVSLRAKSLAVFKYLADRPETVVSKEELIGAVWTEVTVTDDSLTQCVADIRRVLDDTAHQILRTAPRQGYALVPDDIVQPPALDAVGESDNVMPGTGSGEVTSVWRPPGNARSWVAGGLIGVGLLLAGLNLRGGPVPDQTAIEVPENADERTSRLSLQIRPESSAGRAEVAQQFLGELRAVLTRYRTVRLVQNAEPSDYQLLVTVDAGESGTTRIIVDALDTKNDTVFSSRSFAITDQTSLRNSAIRVAAFASPAGGALSRHLMKSAISKPVDKLTRAECFAHAYNCTTCAGRVDNISERTRDCLTAILERDPNDATAWGLQAALHAHQYRFGSAVPEPERSNLQARAHYPKLAVQAASKAETLSDGFDTAIYWGMAQAYGSTCEPEKLANAVDRGLRINPYDPSLLAVFGNWLAYSGRWEKGVGLVERAIEIEPQFDRNWWLFAPAKKHYVDGNYQQAYDGFVKAFNEDNWISHLTLAYTLPYLDRLDDARESLRTVLDRFPGMTVEKALQFYRVNCFEDSYLEKIKHALIQAGMPSRGDSTNLQRVQTIPARLAPVNGALLEYMDIGNGEPIVFVHGAFADYRAWGHYETPISEKFRFISYSQRIFGTRPWPEKLGDYTLDTYADDLAAFIEYLDVGPVHLVTWSFGGTVATLTTIKRPDLFKSVIHFEPGAQTIADDDPALSAQKKNFYDRAGTSLKNLFELLGKGDDQNAVRLVFEFVARLKEGGFDQEPAGTQRMFYDNARTLAPWLSKFKLQSANVTCEAMKKVRIPTLMIYGDKTYPYWAALSRKYAQCLPNASIAVISGATHIAPIRQVDEMVSLITGFVEQQKLR